MRKLRQRAVRDGVDFLLRFLKDPELREELRRIGQRAIVNVEADA